MDVTDDASVERGVATVLAREGRLDVVVNNAGIGIAGAVEETPTAEARAQLETNVLGVLRVCRAVLPAMRRQGGGCIVNVSSLAGLIAVPFQALYSASKFAVEGLTEALRMEVRPWGVRVVLIEPGDFRTGFTGNRRTTPPAAREDSPYRARFVAALRVMEEEEAHGPPPERVARLLERIIDTPAPRLRYTVGLVWERSSAGLKRLLPWSVVEQGLRRYYRLRL